MRYWFVILFFCGFALKLAGQDIVPPVIDYVSINPSSGQVFIQWAKSPTAKVSGYLIRDYKGFGGFTVADVKDSTQTSLAFNYPKVLQQPVTFALNAYRGDSSQLSAFSFPKHRTIFLAFDTNSCQHTITLKWNKYLGWDNKIKSYRINYIHDNFNIESIGTISPNDTTFVFSGYDENKINKFYVSAIRDDGIFSNSNSVTVTVPGPIPPSYIIATQASFVSDKTLEINFMLDPASQVKNYRLTRASNPDSSFQTIQTYNNYTSNSLTAKDSVNGPAYYRLELLNHCNNPIKYSNLAAAIFPQASITNGNVKLSWNKYIHWPGGVQSYDIYRHTNETPELIANTTDNTYADDLNALAGKKISGNICYSVEAKENGGTSRSQSAKVCIDLDLEIFVPQAFTPNGDGKNDEFRPAFAFLPFEFTMVIYNRYGFKVFESKNTENGWNGRLQNGTAAPDGVYVYFIKFKSGSGKIIERNGNFSLIYP